MKKYQGEIVDKAQIQNAYISRLDGIIAGRMQLDDFDWSGMKLLLEYVFKTAAGL